MAYKFIAHDVVIRHLAYVDCAEISEAFTLQGWNKPVEQFRRYFHEMEEGSREVFVAEIAGAFAGYVTVVWQSNYPPFSAVGIPEIVDFNVLIKYQRQGIGTKLMDAAEKIIAQRSDEAGIGVGLTPDYGAAQVLYVKRGYVPDGRGVISHGNFLQYGDVITVDDDFGLYLTKRL